MGSEMFRLESRQKRVLYIATKEIKLLDIPRVLDELGYDVYEARFGLAAQKYENEKCSKIKDALREYKVQYVITYDFILTVSQACMEMGVPYLSWIYDAPQMELYMHSAQYPCNYIFSFDKKQVERLQNIGLRNVMYVPLAVHSAKVCLVEDIVEKKTRRCYESEITFIGQLYRRDNLVKILEEIEDNIKHQIEQNIDKAFLKWGKNKFFHGQMSEECVEELIKHDTKKIQDICPYMSADFFYEAAFLSRIIANRERVYVLNKLAEKYDVNFYTNDEDVSQLNSKVKINPGVSYDLLTHIYIKSKINLNITLHCIETGVPQRVLDVMAAGGFMLSNYQEELDEMFVDREEIVLFRNETELEELVEYYLKHDEERERIARKGQEKVLRDYDYAPWITKVFQYVDDKEKGRKVSYIHLEAEELRKLANHMLCQKEYMQLYNLYSNPKYDTTIRRYRDLVCLREMLKCWKQEQEEGESSIFADIEEVSQAEQKYLKILHCLWRIEQGLSYESCTRAVGNILKQNNSYLLVAWILYANVLEMEKTAISFSELLSEYSVVEAVKFLNAGLRMMEDNQKFLIQQANYLIELQLWELALKTLLRVENPSKELKEIMDMLTNVLKKEV